VVLEVLSQIIYASFGEIIKNKVKMAFLGAEKHLYQFSKSISY
jgi:hypothetical protein